MTPLPKIPNDQHVAMNHRIYMAAHNRRTAHQYRRFHQAMFNETPEQFYWHMREAIRWVQVERNDRKQNGA